MGVTTTTLFRDIYDFKELDIHKSRVQRGSNDIAVQNHKIFNNMPYWY